MQQNVVVTNLSYGVWVHSIDGIEHDDTYLSRTEAVESAFAEMLDQVAAILDLRNPGKLLINEEGSRDRKETGPV
jgi:hypothetical protein